MSRDRPSIRLPKGLQGWLSAVAGFWFFIVCAGQWIFAVYVVGFYVVSGIRGNYELWNRVLPHGYEAGNVAGNASLGIHLAMAALISFGGPLQLIPRLRNRLPSIHRWNGRVYVVLALTMAVTGLFLTLAGRKLVGDIYMHLAISINAILIICFAVMAWSRALQRRYKLHREWALRLFMAVSGVWLFRIGLMFWIMLHGKPVGFDRATFSGPFLTFLSFAVYVMPVVIVELYLRAQRERNTGYLISATASIFVLSIIVAVGIFGAIFGLWLPRLQL